MERRAETDRSTFLATLFAKEAYLQRVQDSTGKNVEAIIKVVHEQIGQVSNNHGGDIITGEGVTKSGT